MNISIMLCTFVLVASSIAMASPAAGYAENYTFRANGKVIGTQSAQLVQVDATSQKWIFDVRLVTPQLAQSGNFVVASNAAPISLTTKATAGGQVQNETLTFGSGKVDMEFQPSIPSIPKSLPLIGNFYLSINNVISVFSIVSRANRLPTDKLTSWQMFSANALQQLAITLTPSGASTIKSCGQMVPCHMFNVYPIQEQFWISDATGDLVMVAAPGQNLEIVKDK